VLVAVTAPTLGAWQSRSAKAARTPACPSTSNTVMGVAIVSSLLIAVRGLHFSSLPHLLAAS
jgi:hypothetical protein